MHAKPDMKVTIIDYGMGNLRSVYNRVKDMCTNPVLSADPKDILDADRLILPGVGHFKQGMLNLEQSGLRAAMEQRVLKDEVPILGICLGMQLFTESSEEGDTRGLGWVPAVTRKFDASKVDNRHFKVPHMGWNTLEVRPGAKVFSELTAQDEMYFCHSYYVECNADELVLADCSYGIRFTAAFAKGNITGMQFHPEKSHAVGANVMRNFINGVAKSQPADERMAS